ncbi:MAG: response regulator [Acetobacteraceae bacterium]
MTHSELAGLRVLVVEDELAIAMMVEMALEDQDCIIVGPYGSLDEALHAARTETMDVALLDINLAGEMVFPAVEVLAERGVPFLLLSGYGDARLPPDRRDWPVCAKPFKLDDLFARLARVVRGG